MKNHVNRFERHPKTTLCLVAIAALLIPTLVLELALRVAGAYSPFDLGFYNKRVPEEPGTYKTAYGFVKFNSFAFHDDEFDLADTRPRIGYFGDSVAYGVGAGYGHRITDRLKSEFTGYQHFNFSRIAGGVSSVDSALDLVDRFGLDKYAYLMNLNDILPQRTKESLMKPRDDDSLVTRIMQFSRVYALVDGLRLRSHLYNLLRTRIRNYLFAKGYVYGGNPAYELEPEKNAAVVTETVDGINRLIRELRKRSVYVCIALLPYEMQISREAQLHYAALGFHWEDGFIARSPQKMILSQLDPDVEVLDTYYAFVGETSVERDRAVNRLGESFVTRSGGAIDWNHPNRDGHRRIAEYLIRENFCSLRDPAARSQSD